MKKRFLNHILILMFFIITTINAWADPLPTPAPSFFPVNPDGTDDPGTPINQIVIWLIASGVVLAAYYLMKSRSKIEVKD